MTGSRSQLVSGVEEQPGPGGGVGAMVRLGSKHRLLQLPRLRREKRETSCDICFRTGPPRDPSVGCCVCLLREIQCSRRTCGE